MENQEGFIPDSEFVPDPPAQAAPSQQGASGAHPPGFIPDDQFVPDKPEDMPGFISDKDFVSDEDKYSSPLQQAGAALEGAAQGVLGPLATVGEQQLGHLGVPGLSDEEIKGRASANPGLHAIGETAGFVGSMATGLGEAGLIAQGLEHLPQGATFFAKVGSAALKGAIQMGLIQGGDEISKALLGQGDPETPVVTALSHMGASALLGATTGGVFSAVGQGASKTLNSIEDSKLGSKLKSFLAGMGHAASGVGTESDAVIKGMPDVEDMHWPSFEQGKNAFNNFTDSAVKKGSEIGGELVGSRVGGMSGLFLGKQFGKWLGGILGPRVSAASQKIATPMILKALASGRIDNLGELLNYATTLEHGTRTIQKGVEGLFKSGANETLDYIHSEKDREKLKEFIENGGVDQQIREQQAQPEGIQGFAKGGHVEPMPQLEHSNAIAHVFPEQNVMMNTAKARISGYLNSVRPLPNQAKLPYDSERKDKQKDREYDKILDLANQPLSILNHVKKGSLLPGQVKAFTQMYPELYGHLSKKITERMMQGQMKEEKKPPYRVRQAMSLFLGTSLDSTLTPAGIAAAQATFIQQKQQSVPKNSASAMNKMGENAMTPEQSRTQRLNKG